MPLHNNNLKEIMVDREETASFLGVKFYIRVLLFDYQSFIYIKYFKCRIAPYKIYIKIYLI